MNREVIAILEQQLGNTSPPSLPPVVAAKRHVDGREIADTIRRARDNAR
jgi:hypothetical protein